MPIIIPKEIPAYSTMLNEKIFVMTEARAIGQDIRPIEIAILNLMPTKIETETQLIRLLSNSPLQINLTLLKAATHESKNTSQSHLDKFYKNFDKIKNQNFDGMIITGAPVETLDFEKVDYWEELKQIMEFADKNVTSAMFLCWGAQAALYYYFGINKYKLPKKLFGVFAHTRAGEECEPLLKGLDDVFYIPHSRYTDVESKVYQHKKLTVIADSKETGAAIIKSKDNKKFFLTGHSEYDRETLNNEYQRDLKKGLKTQAPKNYFTDSTKTKINFNWSATANLIFSNWLNYYVYQVTPYEIVEISRKK